MSNKKPTLSGPRDLADSAPLLEPKDHFRDFNDKFHETRQCVECKLPFEGAHYRHLCQTCMTQFAPRWQRQQRISDWVQRIIAEPAEATSIPQRALRLLEEAIELAQASGLDKEYVKLLCNNIYSRPIGNIVQELGGVSVTLLAMCSAIGYDADAVEALEVQRVLSSPTEKFQKRNVEKNAMGFTAMQEIADHLGTYDER